MSSKESSVRTEEKKEVVRSAAKFPQWATFMANFSIVPLRLRGAARSDGGAALIDVDCEFVKEAASAYFGCKSETMRLNVIPCREFKSINRNCNNLIRDALAKSKKLQEASTGKAIQDELDEDNEEDEKKFKEQDLEARKKKAAEKGKAEQMNFDDYVDLDDEEALMASTVETKREFTLE
jgi:hypothetical protein